MYNEAKDVVAVANSIWVSFDTQSQRPTKLKDIDTKAYVLEPAYPMDYLERKIKIPTQGIQSPPFQVVKSDLDAMNHVNNGHYIRFAQNYLTDDIIVTRVQVDYRKSALIDQVITPVITNEDSKTIVQLTNDAKEIFAIVAFEHKRKDNL